MKKCRYIIFMLITCMLDLIGKKVFLTEEEAVQRIEKLNDTEIIGNATKIN